MTIIRSAQPPGLAPRPRPVPVAAPLPAGGLGADSLQLARPSQPWRVSGGNDIDPLVDRDEVMPRVMETIRGARHTLQFSSYLFGGKVSQDIAKALVERKKAGVNVQVLLDPKLSQVGQDDHGRAIAYLKANGVDVLTYPVEKLNEGEHRWKQGNVIDHAKMLVADGQRAIAGGMNLSDKGIEAHDFMVRIDGEGAAQLGAAFDEDWVLSGGKKAEKPDFRFPTPPGDDGLTISENSATRHTISRLVLSELGKAQRSIAVEALFLDHPDYLQALVDAKGRGVDVQVLLDKNAIKQFMDVVPGGKYAKKLPVDTLPNLPAIAELRKAGIPVHLYDPHDGLTYLHGKLALIDDEVTLLGSANFTMQATNNNRELMMAIDDAQTTRGFKEVFDDDWEHHSTEVKELPKWQAKLAPWIGRAQEAIFGDSGNG